MLSKFLCIFYRKTISFLSKVCHLPHLPWRFSEILSVHSCLLNTECLFYQCISNSTFMPVHHVPGNSNYLGKFFRSAWQNSMRSMNSTLRTNERNSTEKLSTVHQRCQYVKNPATTSLKWIDSFLTPELQMKCQMQEYPKPTPSHDHTECHNKLLSVEAF